MRPSIAIPAGRSLVVRLPASSVCQEPPIPAPETTPTDFAPPSLVHNCNAADPPELRHMPALLHHREDDDDASEASSILPGVMVGNWENVNDDAEDDVPVAAGIYLLRAAGATLQANELAPDE